MNERLIAWAIDFREKFPGMYPVTMAGDELVRAIHRDHYGRVSFEEFAQAVEDKMANEQPEIYGPQQRVEGNVGLSGVETPFGTPPEIGVGGLPPWADWPISMGIGGAVGAATGGPVGALVGAASGAVGTGIDKGLASIDRDENEVPDIPWFYRLPASVLGGGLASRVGGTGVNMLRGSRGLKEGAEEYLEDTAKFGVTRRSGDIEDVAGSARRLEDQLVAVGSRSAMRQVVRQSQDVRNAVKEFARRISPNLAREAAESPDRFVANMLRSGYERVRGISNRLYDRAAQAAGSQPIPINGTASRATQILDELKDISDPGTVGRLAKAIKDLSDKGTAITYDRLRNWQRALNEIVNNPMAVTGPADARAKLLLGGVMDDLDEWAKVSPEAGRAHAHATRYFRTRVAPYRAEDNIWSAASDANFASDELISKIVGSGYGRPDATRLLMKLLRQEGREAVGYNVMSRAADEGATAFASTSFSPAKVWRTMNLRTPGQPGAGRHAFRGAGPGVEADAESLSRILANTLRGTGAGGSNVSVATGKFLSPMFMAKSGLAGGGGIAGLASGGDPLLTAGGALAGGVAAKGLFDVIGSAATSRPFVRAMMSQQGRWAPGLAGAAGGVPARYDLFAPPGKREPWQRNRR